MAAPISTQAPISGQNQDLRIPTLPRETYTQIIQDLANQGFKNLKELPPGVINRTYRMSMGEHKLVVKVIPFQNRNAPFLTKLTNDRGEALLSRLTPHDRINTIDQRIYFGKGKAKDKPQPDTECILDIAPFVEGPDLARVMKKRALSEKEAIQYAIEVGEALLFLHGNGIVHRDIKPENIILCGDHIKLIDHECAKQLDDEKEPLSPIGTPNFQAPEVHLEQWRRKSLLDRLDSYSFGVMLYTFLMQNQVPYDARDQALYFQEGILPPRLNLIANSTLRDLIVGLIERDPSKRTSIHQAVEILKSLQNPK